MDDWNDTPASSDADDFMGGARYPALKFDALGAEHIGIVDRVDKRADRTPDGKPKTWDDGSPQHVFIFELRDPQTGDVGNLWVRGNAVKAIREAVRAGGFNSPLGLLLRIQHHAVGESTRPGFSPPKLYRAQVKLAPPGAAARREPDAVVAAPSDDWGSAPSAPAPAASGSSWGDEEPF